MRQYFFICCAIVFLCSSASYAQTAISPSTPSEQTLQALAQAQNAIVLVSSRAIEDAPSQFIQAHPWPIIRVLVYSI